MRAIVRVLVIMGSGDGQVKARRSFRICCPANAQVGRDRSLQCRPDGSDAGARAGAAAHDGPKRLRIHRPAAPRCELPEYDLLLPNPRAHAPRASADGFGATVAWPAMARTHRDRFGGGGNHDRAWFTTHRLDLGANLV